MRRLPSLGFALALLLSTVPVGRAAYAQDAASGGVASAPPPGAVTPEPYDPNLAKLKRADCKKLARQMVQYTNVAAMASDRGDDAWEQATVAHVDRLEARWNTLCASEDDTWVRIFNAALKTASRLAIKYFTMGYFD